MKTIWKYEIKPVCTLKIPIGATILSVQAQQGKICLWALVETMNGLMPETLVEPRHFVVYGTGHEVDPELDLKHIGTVQMADGNLVLHVFENA